VTKVTFPHRIARSEAAATRPQRNEADTHEIGTRTAFSQCGKS
jgi:hypothetical protein